MTAPFAAPRADLKPNTLDFEMIPLVKATGFREYDARWWFGLPGDHKGKPPELNLLGVQALGYGLGCYLKELGVEQKVVIGHDYRFYSQSIKMALALGLMQSGATVYDIGLAVSPMAYFAQFRLDLPAVAMVTASHNDNGWTGVKMGANRPLTFGPTEMTRLKEIVLNSIGHGEGATVGEGAPPQGEYVRVKDMRDRYLEAVVGDFKLSRKLKIVCACGNGTAGAFAPEALRRMGAEVIEVTTDLDYTFPHYNANPEDMEMLHDMARAVKEHGADLALGFDGDGDRCGVVDNTGEEIFADKIGLMLARDLAPLHPGATFIVDVKSTGLYATDEVLKAHGCKVDYWKTGHSYIKARTKELGALAGFEKSGHFFFAPPLGLGYDDGLIAAKNVLMMLDRNPGQTLHALKSALPMAWTSPTMAPHCDDEIKYKTLERIVAQYQDLAGQGMLIAGRNVRDVNTVNGVRVTLSDGSWVLVRASSNKPELVVVVESTQSEDDMRALFRDEVKKRLSAYPEIGAYNQEI